MSAPKVLLVNPPIYDFTAYDFWLQPYGMFRVAGRLRHACKLSCFNFLVSAQQDEWGRGRFPEEIITKPRSFRDIPRRYRRFGRSRIEFQRYLRQRSIDAVLIQTMMTYWYPGISEVIRDVRQFQPAAKIVLGGIYATLCPTHAASLGADLIVTGDGLDPLWRLLSVSPGKGFPYWPSPLRQAGVMKLTEGCPFRCSYCSVPQCTSGFSTRPVEESLEELKELVRLGAQNVAFYDDALLFKPESVLIPFLQGVLRLSPPVAFHTPNALHARFLSEKLARLLVRAGFKTFFLGLESGSDNWLDKTGGKVSRDEYAEAVRNLRTSGATAITSNIIIGHPDSDEQEVEAAMNFAHKLNTKIQLADFSPIPGTPDGEACRKWVDVDEPLSHNKTAFTLRRLGFERVNSLKQMCRALNSSLPPIPQSEIHNPQCISGLCPGRRLPPWPS
jgi:pyruvate-formate lyase-activating enzyme